MLQLFTMLHLKIFILVALLWCTITNCQQYQQNYRSWPDSVDNGGEKLYSYGECILLSSYLLIYVFVDDIVKLMNEMSRQYLKHVATLHNMKYNWENQEQEPLVEELPRIKRSIENDGVQNVPNSLRDVSTPLYP